VSVTEESGTAAEAPAAGTPRRWFARRPVVAAPALLLVLAGAGAQVLSARARHDPARADRALVDTEATSVVIGDVSNGLTTIFSYAPGTTANTEQAAAEVLDGPAASQYRTLFAQVKEHAAAERLTVTTHVVRAGVVRLTRDTAQLLVFLDQVIVRRDRPKGMSAAAQLAVTARLRGGHWRIVDMHAR
jgi:Mce-associated membrane protein